MIKFHCNLEEKKKIATMMLIAVILEFQEWKKFYEIIARFIKFGGNFKE